MDQFSKKPFMVDGVCIVPTELNLTEKSFFSGVSVNHDIQLVHFLSIERFKQLLESNLLHLSRIDGYADDTTECLYPQINLEKSSNMNVQIEDAFRMTPDRFARYNECLVMRKMTYVHCWFKGDSSNEYMWNKYGDVGRGVCLQGSTHRLRSNIFFNHNKFVGNVCECVYCDPDEVMPDVVSWFPAIRKDKQRFGMEQEIRFLIRHSINKIPHSTSLDQFPAFQKLTVNLGGLIESIYLGPSMDSSERELSSQIINEAGFIEKLKPLPCSLDH